MSNQPKHFYEFGPFRLDPAKQRLLRDGEPVPLTPKALATLLVLIKNRGRVVEKDYLMEAVWPDTFVEEGVLSVNINALRKALDETVEKRQYIETIPRRGYRFVATVREVLDESAAVAGKHTHSQIISREEEETVGQDTAPPDITALNDYKFQAKRRPSLHEAVRSIAVLPFKSLSTDDEDEYLWLGMADALITRLSNIKQIVVRPTSAVRKYTTLTLNPVVAGRELSRAVVMEHPALSDRFAYPATRRVESEAVVANGLMRSSRTSSPSRTRSPSRSSER